MGDPSVRNELNKIDIQQAEIEDQFILATEPRVLDSGNEFVDNSGAEHTNASGWKSIMYALKFLRCFNKLPEKFVRKFTDEDLTAVNIKDYCGFGDHLSAGLKPEQLDWIGTLLGLQFMLHRPARCERPRYGAKRNAYIVHLHLYRGHYTVLIDPLNWDNAMAFAIDQNEFGIEFVNLGELIAAEKAAESTDEDLDAALALSLAID